MKQTAVQWLADKMLTEHHSKIEWDKIVDQAKAMEKEQSQKMYEYAAWAMFYNGHGQTFDQYWNKTFKSE